MPVHVAITRRVRAGCEEEFRQGLREFFQKSFAQDGVCGASMLTPGPGSESREYGILRTFATERERDAFYTSATFKAWEEKARKLTEGEPVVRELHGLEAWFRSPNPPPRWRMAIATFIGVFPTAMSLDLILGPTIQAWPFFLRGAAFNACVVTLLTWVVMPLVVRALRKWLHAAPAQTKP